jgi:septal ring-binding cell division protein DamX
MSTRPVRVIIAGALDELRLREARLLEISNELAAVQEAIKTLTKLNAKTAVALHPTPAPQTAPPRRASVHPVAAENQIRERLTAAPLSVSQLQAATALPASAIRTALQRLCENSEAVRIGSGRSTKYRRASAIRDVTPLTLMA